MQNYVPMRSCERAINPGETTAPEELHDGTKGLNRDAHDLTHWVICPAGRGCGAAEARLRQGGVRH